MLDLAAGDPQHRHVDRGWAPTVHAFQGHTVNTVIAAMEADHPHLTTRKSFYVEISRARDRAELVTDDRAALKEQLEAATGERIAALDAVGPDNAVERLASEILLNDLRLKAMLWVRCIAMDVDPSNARHTGQIISIHLSGPSGPLQIGVQY